MLIIFATDLANMPSSPAPEVILFALLAIGGTILAIPGQHRQQQQQQQQQQQLLAVGDAILAIPGHQQQQQQDFLQT